MEAIFEIKLRADQLKNSGNYNEAAPLFQQVWAECPDEGVGADLLKCFRKTKQWDKALQFSSNATQKFPYYNRLKNEHIWTHIQYLQSRIDSLSPDQVFVEANEIFLMGLQGLPLNKLAFSILKYTKAHKNWAVFNEWVEKIDPLQLSTEPAIFENGKAGWSDQERWFHYKIIGLNNSGKENNAIALCETCIKTYSKKAKFFRNDLAQAYLKKGDLKKALEEYLALCSQYPHDDWIFRQYADSLIKSGNSKEALSVLCFAAINCRQPLHFQTSTFDRIGNLFSEFGKNTCAFHQYVLIHSIHKQSGNHTPIEVLTCISQLYPETGEKTKFSSLQEIFEECKNDWKEYLDANPCNSGSSQNETRKDLVGNVFLGQPEAPFCFVKSNNGESYFCLKVDLPVGIADKERVFFDGIPSFDRKKNMESWKAVRIRSV
jgi:tetratricopeptide (TPR) repeat protein